MVSIPTAPLQARQTLLQLLADRAYRRPARSDEVDRLVQVAESRRAQGKGDLTAWLLTGRAA